MRAIWKGAVSFGLVSIPVKLYSATEEKNIKFRQVHREDGGRIRYRRICEIDGEEVSYDDIAKGYDLGGGEIVVLTDEDFAELPLASSRAIEVLEFVPAEQVDPMLMSKTYYLEPEGVGAKPYALMTEALERSDRVAIVKVALRQREQLATLRVRSTEEGSVLVMGTMLWPDEIREPDFAFLDEDLTVRKQELAMAESLIDSMTGDFDPEAYTDDYREALQAVIDAKIAGHEIVSAEPAAEPAAATDLMAALQASVERARSARGETGGDASSKSGSKSGSEASSEASAGGDDAKPKKKAAKKAAKKATKKEELKRAG